MIAIENKQIQKAFLGSNELKRIYKGTELVYDSLPYDAEIEYLQSTGTQWIDTDYICNDLTEVEAKFQYTKTTAQQYLFSNATAWEAILAFYINGGTKFAFSATNSKTYSNTQITPNTDIHTIKIPECSASGYVYLDNTSFYYAKGTRKNEPMRIFASIGDNPYGKSSLKLYSISFKENGILKMDLVPVRRGNVGYLYDKISGKLFGNSGSGNFILGNDI